MKYNAYPNYVQRDPKILNPKTNGRLVELFLCDTEHCRKSRELLVFQHLFIYLKIYDPVINDYYSL